MSLHWMDGWGWAMMTFGFLFWIALIALAIWLIGHRAQPSRAEEPRDGSAREILDRRLARGEIDPDAYTRAVELLTRRGEPSGR